MPHSYSDLLTLAEQFAPADPATMDGYFHATVLDTLQLDVLGERPNGDIIVFAKHPSRRKTDTIRNIEHLAYVRLLQIAGKPAEEYVDATGEDEEKLQMSIVRNAIAYHAGQRRFTEDTLAGPGCWAGIGPRGEETEEILLVGAGEYSVWDGTTLTRGCRPTACGRLLDISRPTHWYNHDELGRLLAACNPVSNQETIDECEALFERWNWRHNDASSSIMVGLVLASWVQTHWQWRPHIAITGDTKTGKTTLFETLDGIFGSMAVRSSRSTAAGIRQALQGTGQIPLCDEFEHSHHRKDILEMIRSSSRGDRIIRGSTDHRKIEFVLRHIFWIAAIEVGLQRVPDRNRFIQLELMPPAKGMEGKLVTPPPESLRGLGQRLLAIAVHSAAAARRLAIHLKSHQIEGIDARVVESYSVPVAILAVALGYSDADTLSLLADMTATAPAEEQQASDQEDILLAIFRSIVDLDRGRKVTVAELWDGVDSADYCEALQRVGIRRAFQKRGARADWLDRGKEYCFLDPHSVRERLLKNSEWAEQTIEKILQRIDGASMARRRLVGGRANGVLIPVEYLENSILAEDEDDEPKE